MTWIIAICMASAAVGIPAMLLVTSLLLDWWRHPVELPLVGGRMTTGPDGSFLVEWQIAQVVQRWPGDRDATWRALAGIVIDWIPADPALGTRHILDGLGRHVAGDHRGKRIRVVYIAGDEIRHTALAHEIAHVLLERDGDGDPDHVRDDVWGYGGIVDMAMRAQQ